MSSSELGNSRVRAFLRARYGKDPEPLRSFLTWAEAMDIAKESSPAKVVSQDLNTAGYGGKWTRAIEHQIRKGSEPGDWQFWHDARLFFLELGGDYKREYQPPSKCLVW